MKVVLILLSCFTTTSLACFGAGCGGGCMPCGGASTSQMTPVGNGCCCPMSLPQMCLPSFSPPGCCCPMAAPSCPPQAPPCLPAAAQPVPQYSYAAPQASGCGGGGCSPFYG